MAAVKKVIVIQKGMALEVWGALTSICEAHEEFSYSTLSDKKFPFTYKGWDFSKVPYNAKFKNKLNKKTL